MRVGYALFTAVCFMTSASASPADPISFFTESVKPVLTSQCGACHGEQAMGGLRLDSREHVLRGGKSGPVIVPGNPDASLLIQAVSHTHAKLKMPPTGRLTDNQIGVLRKWIEAGAHWDSATPSSAAAVIESSRPQHWAFQLVRKSEVPAVRDGQWPRSPIDRFILGRLEAKGLKPAGPAGRRALIRRATFDLTGLPPTPEEVDALVNDTSPEAFAKVVDRLLASPHYGERWGRHWLDVARYADEDALGLSAEVFPNAFRYRNWVIQAFNSDMPYDLFVKAQIAGDLIEKEGGPALRPGLGLFALGPWYYKIIEPPKARADERHDRVDVLTRGFLGLTVACARCHDHKYDPITTKDYYALAGVFANSEMSEYPLAAPDVVKTYDEQQQKVTTQQELITKALDAERKRVQKQLARQVARYLLAAADKRSAESLDRGIVQRFREYLVAPELAHPFLNGFRGHPSEANAEAVEKRVLSIVAEKEAIDEHNRRIIEESKKSTDPYDIFCKGCNAVTRALPRDEYVLWTDCFGQKQRSREKQPGLFYYSDSELDRFLAPEQKPKIETLRNELASLKKALPEKYPFLHTISDIKTPVDLRLHLRGDPYNLGDPVPRKFLAVLSGRGAPAFRKGSGRLELAEAIASAGNPLTARVMVNRVWRHHFGIGLVRTASNFGIASERPSHPELLDYLAATFVENGWSVKRLHREIMLSTTYALASSASVENSAVDPENRLLWRFNRRRLDIESLRDAILAVGGTLDEQICGQPMEWNKDNRCRTVYGRVSRFKLERMLSLFDFPDPSITCEQRAITNVPPQKLFFLNSEMVLQQSSALAQRLAREAGADRPARIDLAYRLLFGRAASEQEQRAAEHFLSDGTWDEYCLALLSSNEFSFVE